MVTNKRQLHHNGRKVFRQDDYSFASVVRYYDNALVVVCFVKDEKGNFVEREFGWYLDIAIQKLDAIQEDRHLITLSLIMQYAGAIRQAYQRDIIKSSYGKPRNKNTIRAVKAYIEKMKNEKWKNY